MAVREIGQKWEVYDYQEIRTAVIENGEDVKLINTPDYPSEVITLTGDGVRDIDNLYTAWKERQGGTLNRTVVGNDSTVGTVIDTGGDLSIPVPVTVPAGVITSDTLPGTGTMPLRSWLHITRNNLANLFGRVGWAESQIESLGKHAGTFDTFAQLLNNTNSFPSPPTVNDFVNVRADETVSDQ